MYVAPRPPRHRTGRRILAELERIAREHGCGAVRLDTSAYLTAAVALYRAAGYREVADYNGNRKADLWFEPSWSPSCSRPTTPAGRDLFESERVELEAARSAVGRRRASTTSAAPPSPAWKPSR